MNVITTKNHLLKECLAIIVRCVTTANSSIPQCFLPENCKQKLVTYLQHTVATIHSTPLQEESYHRLW